MINNKNGSLISIVILNYNGLRYLRRTLPPILNLDYENLEFIVVDNGSNDGSLEFLKKHGQVKIIENSENIGYGPGKNVGVDAAQGKFVLLLDNDILIKSKDILDDLLFTYKPNIGIIQVPLLDENQEKTTYYGIFFSIYGANLHKKSVPVSEVLKYGFDVVDIGAPTGGCMFFSKSLWIDAGRFDESQPFNLDDIDIGPRVSIMGYRNVLYTKDFFLHLGINKTDRAEAYAARSKFLFSGHARAMIKNYNLVNLLVSLPILTIFQFVKSVRYSVLNRSILPLVAFIQSLCIFLSNILSTIKQRYDIQSKRKLKSDVFLKIKVPKFD